MRNAERPNGTFEVCFLSTILVPRDAFDHITHKLLSLTSRSNSRITGAKITGLEHKWQSQ
jgi:hypothetical protein